MVKMSTTTNFFKCKAGFPFPLCKPEDPFFVKPLRRCLEYACNPSSMVTQSLHTIHPKSLQNFQQNLKSLSTHELHVHVVIMHEHVANSFPILQLATKLLTFQSLSTPYLLTTFNLFLPYYHLPILHHSFSQSPYLLFNAPNPI